MKDLKSGRGVFNSLLKENQGSTTCSRDIQGSLEHLLNLNSILENRKVSTELDDDT